MGLGEEVGESHDLGLLPVGLRAEPVTSVLTWELLTDTQVPTTKAQSLGKHRNPWRADRGEGRLAR